VVEHDDPKRSAVLAAALGVFGRYGFRKTSMDAVAKAAGISRPGLYLLFPNKEDLYRATMQGLMERAQRMMEARFADEALSFEQRIVEALDVLMGPYVESQVARDLDDLAESSEAQLGPMLHGYQERAKAALRAAVESLAPPGVLTDELGADAVADVFYAAGLTWKREAATRAEFREKVRRLVRLVCRVAD
jgi:AcrR family transcriptional regulator